MKDEKGIKARDRKGISKELKIFLLFFACFSFVLCCNIAHADKGIVATEITKQVDNPLEIMGFKLLDQNPISPTKDVLSKVKFEKPIKDNGLNATIDMNDTSPSFEVSKWEGEARLKVNISTQAKSKNKKSGSEDIFELVGADDETHQFYTINEEDGKLEWNITLTKKMKNNCISFDAELTGLDCFYQAPLYIDAGLKAPNATCNATDCLDSHRPEEVVGSYACYGKNSGDYSARGGKNYGAGKAFDIPKPLFIDASGREIYGTINITSNQLTLCVDKSWNQKATYPMIIDPTIGYSKAGGSTESESENYLTGTYGSNTTSGTVDTINFYSKQLFLGWAGVMVKASDMTILTNGDKAGTGCDGFSAGWCAATYTSKPSVSANSVYLVSVIINTGGGLVYYDTNVTNSGARDTSNSYSTPTNPTDATNSTKKYSIYASYTTSADPNGFTVVSSLPTNNSYTNSTTPVFTFNASGTNSSYNTSLNINGSWFGTNSSVLNASTSTILANATVPQGNSSWYIACTNGTISNNSATSYIIVDSIAPNATITQPLTNGSMNSSSWEINISVTEANINQTNCSIYNSTGSLINSTTNTSTGSVKCYTSIYVNGTFNITVTTKDLAGNVNSTTNSNISQTIYAGASNSCTCPGSGSNWTISMLDHCVINSTCNLGTGKLKYTGSGNFTCNATINSTSMDKPPASSTIWVTSLCHIKV